MKEILRKIVFLCWMYIIGVVAGLIFFIHESYHIYLYIPGLICLAVGVLLILINKLKTVCYIFMIAAGIILGIAMYNNTINTSGGNTPNSDIMPVIKSGRTFSNA